MTLVELQQRAANVVALQAAIKEHSMLYQADLKERCARWLGLSYDEFYHLPYTQWADVRAYCRAHGGPSNY